MHLKSLSKSLPKTLMEGESLLNRYLGERTARDIDSRVRKVLRDLGDPEPPLRLEEVREVLDLDRAYYSSGDDGILRETVHRLKMAGKQVIKRPALLLEVVRKLDLKALWIPDRKRILLDKELPSAKQRWAEAHEIGHSLLPWHELVMHGDQSRTLSYASQQQLESEANFAAGRMLFLQDGFMQHLESADFNFDRVREISKRFGNTITSTLWRSVESTDKAAFGLVSQHPQHPDGINSSAVRYFVRSRAFETQFAQTAANARASLFSLSSCEPISTIADWIWTNLGLKSATTVACYRRLTPDRLMAEPSTRVAKSGIMQWQIIRRRRGNVIDPES